ncbi:protein of unknown function (plasmid) [Cupriavidus taiwanensis]|uniref:Uncharacterized protein n=1 Tax=Cupriavidus taiwanensis TaxID=164546 RepID=A0A375EG34_9BURK|nr:protein of unknown function [Cupriavidus taiwanensis]SOZ74366.1 protein of unknown function [Cupriavidus taiwanensis]
MCGLTLLVRHLAWMPHFHGNDHSVRIYGANCVSAIIPKWPIRKAIFFYHGLPSQQRQHTMSYFSFR